jgi:hypothetical protein
MVPDVNPAAAGVPVPLKCAMQTFLSSFSINSPFVTLKLVVPTSVTVKTPVAAVVGTSVKALTLAPTIEKL